MSYFLVHKIETCFLQHKILMSRASFAKVYFLVLVVSDRVCPIEGSR